MFFVLLKHIYYHTHALLFAFELDHLRTVQFCEELKTHNNFNDLSFRRNYLAETIHIYFRWGIRIPYLDEYIQCIAIYIFSASHTHTSSLRKKFISFVKSGHRWTMPVSRHHVTPIVCARVTVGMIQWVLLLISK